MSVKSEDSDEIVVEGELQMEIESESDDNKDGFEETKKDDLINEKKKNEIEFNDDNSDDEQIINTNLLELDLCFLCDITSSMKPWINTIKEEIINLSTKLKNDLNINKMRISFVGYRDYLKKEDHKNRLQIKKFTSNVDKFKQYITNIVCDGGDDVCEDVLGGLNRTLLLKWNLINPKCVKLIYHILDAPPHGTIYHEFFDEIKKKFEGKHKKTNSKNAALSLIADELNSDDSDTDTDTGEDNSSDEQNKKNNNNKKNKLIKPKNDYSKVVDSYQKQKQDEYDLFPNKHPNDPKHEDILRELKTKGIQYYIGKAAPNKSTLNKMIKVFQEYSKFIEYQVSTLDLGNAQKLIPTLCTAVSNAVRIVNNPNIDKNDININLNEMNKKQNFKVHCGIDFGTAGTAYAYVVAGTKQVNIQDATKAGNLKISTSILFDPKGNFFKFGDEANRLYTHGNYEDYLFFERFKMQLYDKKINTGEIDENNENKNDEDDGDDNENKDKQKITTKLKKKLKAMNGKELSTKHILCASLKYMKDTILTDLRKKLSPTLAIEDIQWILTVPAIWNDSAKSTMRIAAQESGMINKTIQNHLLIAYEPDCASLTIQHEYNDKYARSIKDPKAKFFKPGDRYILCDIGGGTADIAVHEIDDNYNIKEINEPSGGPWGSTYVDERFIKLLKIIFPIQWFNEFMIQEPTAYFELLQNFQKQKKTFTTKSKDNVKKETHNVELPFAFIDFMNTKCEEYFEENDKELFDKMEEDDNDEFLNEYIKKKKLTLKKGKIGMTIEEQMLVIPISIWKEILFDPIIKLIIEHCKILLQKLFLSDYEHRYHMFLVGGFSDNEYLRVRFFKVFKNVVKIRTATRPILSVVSGAALMGLQPNYISGRVISRTYGVKIQKTLDEFKNIFPDMDVDRKKLSKVNGQWVVNDIFFPFIRKGDIIKKDDKPIIQYLMPADNKTDEVIIQLYDYNKKDTPIFVPNKCLREIKIKLDKNRKNKDKPIAVGFVFCDTTLRVFISDSNNNNNHQQFEIDVDYDSVRKVDNNDINNAENNDENDDVKQDDNEIIINDNNNNENNENNDEKQKIAEFIEDDNDNDNDNNNQNDDSKKIEKNDEIENNDENEKIKENLLNKNDDNKADDNENDVPDVVENEE